MLIDTPCQSLSKKELIFHLLAILQKYLPYHLWPACLKPVSFLEATKRKDDNVILSFALAAGILLLTLAASAGARLKQQGIAARAAYMVRCDLVATLRTCYSLHPRHLFLHNYVCDNTADHKSGDPGANPNDGAFFFASFFQKNDHRRNTWYE